MWTRETFFNCVKIQETVLRPARNTGLSNHRSLEIKKSFSWAKRPFLSGVKYLLFPYESEKLAILRPGHNPKVLVRKLQSESQNDVSTRYP